MKTKRTCLVVLGMHRSGTSALTRLLNMAGAALPERVMGAGIGNPTGHWEPSALVRSHDVLLATLRSSWHDWKSVHLDALTAAERDSTASEMSAIIEADYGDADLFVLKDPRICRFFPFLAGVLDRMQVAVIPVLIMRNPIDVVSSMNKRVEDWSEKTRAALAPRNAVNFEGYLLWLRHVLDSERSTRSFARCLVTYDELLADWRSVLANIERQTGLTFPNQAEAMAPRVDEFLSTDHRHHKSSSDIMAQRPELEGIIRTTYKSYLKLQADPGSRKSMKRLDNIAQAMECLEPVLDQICTENRVLLQSQEEQYSDLETTYMREVTNLSDQVVDLKRLQSDLSSDIEKTRDILSVEPEDRRPVSDITAAFLGDFHDQAKKLQALKSVNASLNASIRMFKGELDDMRAELADHRTQQQLERIQSKQDRMRLEAEARHASCELRGIASQAIAMRDLMLKQSHQSINEDRSMILAKAVHWLRQRTIMVCRSGDFSDQMLIEKSVFFNEDWYLIQNPDVHAHGMNPARHYLRFGFSEGRCPSPHFDPVFYLNTNPDVREADINPLVHFLRYGLFEGRLPYASADLDRMLP